MKEGLKKVFLITKNLRDILTKEIAKYEPTDPKVAAKEKFLVSIKFTNENVFGLLKGKNIQANAKLQVSWNVKITHPTVTKPAQPVSSTEIIETANVKLSRKMPKKRFLNVEYSGIRTRINITEMEDLSEVQDGIKVKYGPVMADVGAAQLQLYDQQNQHINTWALFNSLPQEYFTELGLSLVVPNLQPNQLLSNHPTVTKPAQPVSSTEIIETANVKLTRRSKKKLNAANKAAKANEENDDKHGKAASKSYAKPDPKQVIPITKIAESKVGKKKAKAKPATTATAVVNPIAPKNQQLSNRNLERKRPKRRISRPLLNL